jgi:hypothetical protein
MLLIDNARKCAIAAGLLAIAVSLVFDANVARDATIPEPATAALFAVAGAASIAAGLIRRRRK